MNYVYGFNGIPVYLNESLGDYKQLRTHKRRRINKKWAKRYGFMFAPDKQIYIIESPYGGGKQIIAHRVTI